MAETFRNSVDHHKQNRLVVIWQLIIFALAFLLGTFTKLLLPGIPSEILFKFVDVLFISGTILLAVKLAREGWDPLPLALPYSAWDGVFSSPPLIFSIWMSLTK